MRTSIRFTSFIFLALTGASFAFADLGDEPIDKPVAAPAQAAAPAPAAALADPDVPPLVVPGADAKKPLKVTKLDKNSRIAPFNFKAFSRFYLAMEEHARRQLANDPTISPEIKKKIEEQVSEEERNFVSLSYLMRNYSPMKFAMVVCGAGIEVNLGRVVPNKLEYKTPFGFGNVCGIVAFTESVGGGLLDTGIGVGAAIELGGYLQSPNKKDDGTYTNSGLIKRTKFSIVVPFSGAHLIETIGDLQGNFVGGGLHWATDTQSKLLENKASGSFSVQAKFTHQGIKPGIEAVMINWGSGESKVPSGWEFRWAEYTYLCPFFNFSTTRGAELGYFPFAGSIDPMALLHGKWGEVFDPPTPSSSSYPANRASRYVDNENIQRQLEETSQLLNENKGELLNAGDKAFKQLNIDVSREQ